MAIVTNFGALKSLHDEARRCGTNSRAWIEFAATMMDSFPSLFQTARAMNARQAALEAALRDLVAQVELHTDCMDGRIDASALDAQIDAAERLVGAWPDFNSSKEVA